MPFSIVCLGTILVVRFEAEDDRDGCFRCLRYEIGIKNGLVEEQVLLRFELFGM